MYINGGGGRDKYINLGLKQNWFKIQPDVQIKVDKSLEFQNVDGDKGSFHASLIGFLKFFFPFFFSFCCRENHFMANNSKSKLKAKHINMSSLQCHQYERVINVLIPVVKHFEKSTLMPWREYEDSCS